MLISTLIVAAIWPVVVTKHCEPKTDAAIVGIARNGSGEVIYCEIANKIDSSSLKITYMASGKVFAEKTLSFSANPFLPSVIQKDFRAGEFRQAVVSNQDIKLSYQPNSRKKIEESVIPLQNVDIVDAGFDKFIRAHWDDLQTGKTFAVNFASIAHLKTLPLRVHAQPIEKCLIKQDDVSISTCFFVEIDSSLFRIILGNIKLTYDQQRRLYEFNGVVNIEDGKQNNQNAIIRYFYIDDYLNQNIKNQLPH
jgi:hypothetical protein